MLTEIAFNYLKIMVGRKVGRWKRVPEAIYMGRRNLRLELATS